eukprot:ANDGO_03873.mRNA.1 F-box-like/WD repeat-containing protein ebi
MSLTSEEVNYLVYRYLQESGFSHSAFTFGSESLIYRSSINTQDVPPGALISFIQKGIQYLEIEASLADEDGGEVFGHVTASAPGTPAVASLASAFQSQQNGIPSTLFADSEVTTLRGHQGEVPIVRWNPVANMLASGSGDCTARLWSFNPDRSIVLPHDTKDVTALEFSPDGQLLLTGSMDGVLRIWRSADGQLVQQFNGHRGCVFNAKWNRSGVYVASVAKDKTALVWNPATNSVYRQYPHGLPVLDIDWRDNTMFATSCVDRLVRVFDLEMGTPGLPVRVFEGHEHDVNSVRFSSSGELLASCSDDRTIKIWNVANPSALSPVYNLTGHTDAVFVIRWSPRQPNLLLSGSSDGQLRLWDITSGLCVGQLREHKEGISAAAFSPDGTYFASASADGRIFVWSVRDQKIVKSFSSDSPAFDVCFSPSGERLAASFGDSRVVIFEWRS